MSSLEFSNLRTPAATAVVAAAILWLTGCASIPASLRDGPEHGPDPAQVQGTPEQYVGKAVRWGGVIAAVDNGPVESVVQVVSRPLSSAGRPLETDRTSGRFLVHVAGFLDPVVYASGRELTVVGQVEGVEQHNIGAYPYRYPVVRASSHYLWQLRPPPAADPYFYPPFHRPWYPYGPYPWP
jgi:outer membrane lipoprotein